MHILVLDVFEAALKEFGDVAVIQADEDVAALFTGADDAFVAQSAQLMRNRRFAQVEFGDEFRDADLVILREQRNDLKAGGVAERVEEFSQFVSGI